MGDPATSLDDSFDRQTVEPGKRRRRIREVFNAMVLRYELMNVAAFGFIFMVRGLMPAPSGAAGSPD